MSLLFVIVYLLVPLFILKFMQTSGLSVLRLSIPSVVIVSMFVFAYVGLLPLYFGWAAYPYATGVQDRSLVFLVFTYTSWTILSMVAAYAFCVHVIGFGKISNEYPDIQPLSGNGIFLLAIILVSCFAVLRLYLSKLDSVALFVVLTKGSEAAQVSRSMMGNAFGGRYHWYSVFMHDILNFATFSLFAAVLKKRGFVIVSLFILAFSGSIFSALMATEKAPAAYIVIGLFITFWIVRQSGRIPFRSLLVLGLVVIGILAGLYVVVFGIKMPLRAMAAAFSRTFTGQIQPAYHYLEFFPSHQPYLYGRSFPNPGGIMPYTPYRLTVEVMNWRFPQLATQGITGSMPTVFWGEMYANFGVIGIAVAGWIAGIGLFVVEYLIRRIRFNPIVVGFLVWSMLHYGNLSITGLSGFIIDFQLGVLLSLFFLSLFVMGHGKIVFRRTRSQKNV